ncbi:MAG: CHAT domain-containing protein [Oscillatoriales cyanobacterium RM2_1_1]|nr:CHAT domain-containing protein [Oscillatoriales cyanobacterium RM2_1_1]
MAILSRSSLSPSNTSPTIIKLVLLWNSNKSQFRARLMTNDGSFNSRSGFLPRIPPELETVLSNWRQVYYDIPQVRLKTKGVVHGSCANANNQAKANSTQIKAILNLWLEGNDPTWQPIRESLIKASGQLGESVHLLVEIEDQDENGQLQPLSPVLRRLPWQEWNLFKQHFPQAEVILQVEGNNSGLKSPQPWPKPRILVVFGDNEGIDLTPDRQVVQLLKQQGAEVRLLEQPDYDELSEALRSELGYHLFVFSGHSRSDDHGGIGWLELSPNRSLEIQGDAFIRAFSRAVSQGLQVAIFNSCDGIGLANQLAKIGLPRSIVMREVVPNEVAASFLKYFFQEFAGKQRGLVPAFHQAREQLADCHYDSPYPGATWLPMLCMQDAVAAQPLFWKDFILQKSSFRLLKVLGFGILTLALSGLAYWGLRSKSLIAPTTISSPESSQTINQLISQGERLLISENTNPAKEAGIQAYLARDYGKAIEQFRQALLENRNDPESWIYLNNAIAEQKFSMNIGRLQKIALSVPITDEVNAAQEVLRGVAQAQSRFNCNLPELIQTIENFKPHFLVLEEMEVHFCRLSLEMINILRQRLRKSPKLLSKILVFLGLWVIFPAI